jgi:hypothetical protein
MNTEVEINTNVDVEFDDDAVWEAIEDRVEREIQSNLELYSPWDAVSGDVENYVEDAISDHGGRIDWSDGDEHLESLLDQFSTRIRNGDTLCELGRSARKAIEAVMSVEGWTHIPVAERVDQIRIDQDLDVQHRINTLERQVKTLLAAITALGERAASVTPDSVV